MPDISRYTDYRKFLKDYYKAAKHKNRGFSYKVFSSKAGLTSKGFLFNAISGKRTLSRSNILGLIQALKLNKYEADYFENLVAFNQAKNLNERNHYFGRLSSIKASGTTAWKPQVIRNDQFEFYSRLHHSVIRSLIGLNGFKNDYKELARSIVPRITAGQAKKSVALLESLEFIRRREDGTLAIADKSIATTPEVRSLAVQNFHKEAGELGLKALSGLTNDKRNISGVTLGISRETYEKICEELQVFRSRLLQMAEADQNADTVYQLNFQFFPVSKPAVGTAIERKET